jgi:hypothetical protein
MDDPVCWGERRRTAIGVTTLVNECAYGVNFLHSAILQRRCAKGNNPPRNSTFRNVFRADDSRTGRLKRLADAYYQHMIENSILFVLELLIALFKAQKFAQLAQIASMRLLISWSAVRRHSIWIDDGTKTAQILTNMSLNMTVKLLVGSDVSL